MIIYHRISPILQRILKLTIGGGFLCLLGACGLKGPLYLPDPAPTQTISQPARMQPPITTETTEIVPAATNTAPK